MLDQFVKYVVGEMRVIAEAPATFVVATLAVASAIWWLMEWRYSGVIAYRDAEISSLKTQRDEYKDKLGGASPDQAKARIDALELRLAAVEPRRLTAEQRTILSTQLRLPIRTRLVIASEGTGDSPQFSADISSTFRAAGSWEIQEPMVTGIGNRPPSGIGIYLQDPRNPSSEARIIMTAFRAAGISFDIGQRPPRQDFPIEILICTKVIR